MAEDAWYYAKGQEKLGPVPGSRLKSLVASGELRPDALVWSASLDDWKPYADVELMVPGEDVPAPVSAALAQGTKEALPIPADLKRANFAKLIVVGSICVALFGVLIGYVIFAGSTMGATGAASAWEPTVAIVAGVGVVLLGLYIYLIVLGMICVYRAWKLLQPFGASTTPGLAVGLQFIPVFNLFWYFRAYRDWAREYNAVVATDERLTMAPRASEGTFLTFCVASVITFPLDLIRNYSGEPMVALVSGVFSVVALVCVVIMFYQICSAVNFFVDLRDREAEHGVIG